MPTKIGIGFSHNLNLEKAAREAAYNAKSQMGEVKVDLAIIFFSIQYDPLKFLPSIKKIINAHRTIGCSCAGIILSQSIETQGLAVLGIASDEINFGIGFINSRGFPDPHKAGNSLAQNCISDYGQHNRNGFIYFADNRIPNLSSFLRGLQEVFGKVFPILGATSSDDYHFTNNFQIFEDQALQLSAIGLILGGHISLGIGSRHGWKPLGKPRIINKAENNIIRSIDGKKASAFYEEYFAKISNEKDPQSIKNMSMLYPLGIYINETKEFLLRNILEILPNGSIVCQGDIPSGATVHIMISNKDLCIEAAYHAAEEALSTLKKKKPKLIFIIESMARYKILGRAADQEIEKIKEIFDDDVPLIGMYSNSETYPFRLSDTMLKSNIQNESIIVLAIS